MFNATQLVINAFVDELHQEYIRNYGHMEEGHGEILAWAGRMALERIARTDALYHNLGHTLLVTLVGQEILRGRHLKEGGVTSSDWMHCMISLLCHDIGYVSGICLGDTETSCQTGVDNKMVDLPAGATDAFLTPYHVDRGILFIKQRFSGHKVINVNIIAKNIALTRFPVPDQGVSNDKIDYPNIIRAADLIGQLADPDYLIKLPALFHEFEENSINKFLGYTTPADLRAGYPTFYWKQVYPHIQKALGYLEMTIEGRQWIANLYSHVFIVENEAKKQKSD